MSIHYRPPPVVRSSASSLAPSIVSSRAPTPRHSPLIPPPLFPIDKYDTQTQPTICGMPLKYVSLVTLAVQNAALSIVMHYSRVSIPTSLAYSPATAVLLNELLKGSISFIIALMRAPVLNQPPLTRRRPSRSVWLYLTAFTDLCGDIFSPDCWKLSIPAILYVVQNSLQFVAIANLPVASFQVTYQMKILTTAAFSVVLLRRRLSSVKWLSLFFLAIGVGIVQIQSTAGTGNTVRKVLSAAGSSAGAAVGSAHEFHVHVMNPLKGFGAVTAACFTSGLAGVYFEMVLKGSKADLWVRNVQLSLFSLIPALLPLLWASPPANSQGFLRDMFRNFGAWAWATVAIQVFGGLVTAVVIKYSDNILKGFATSLSIVLSFLASIALFDFHMTPSFIIGAGTVLGATWMYNQPTSGTPGTPLLNGPGLASGSSSPPGLKGKEGFSIVLNDGGSPGSSGKSSPSSLSMYYPDTPGSPAGAGTDASALGQLGLAGFMRRKSGGLAMSRSSSSASLSALLGGVSGAGLGPGSGPGVNGGVGGGRGELGLAESGELVHASDGEISPFSSRGPSRMGSRPPSPSPRLGSYGGSMAGS